MHAHQPAAPTEAQYALTRAFRHGSPRTTHDPHHLQAGTAMSMQIIVLPWLARWYNPDLIPALMFGNNLGSNLGAITGLIQKPGDKNSLFG